MFVRCFSLTGVDVEVVGARVLADDHALVDLLAGPDEQRAALLQVHQRELGGRCRGGRRRATPVGRVRSSPNHGSQPSKTWCSRPVPRVSVRNSVRKPISPRAGTQVLHPDPAGAVVDHLLERALAQREQLGDDADVVLGHVDRQPLDRLVQLAVDLAR